MPSPLKISNRHARRLWLKTQELASAPTGPVDVSETIRRLGYVQLDTIRIVARAHHHILWSRNRNYREDMLAGVMAADRSVFEHYTHDASILPMEFYPMWRRQFRRLKEKRERSKYFSAMPDRPTRDAIKKRIADEGPLSTHAFDTKVAGSGKMWARPPHKLALDYMWYAGELATSPRENFTKFYDLAERVIPAEMRDPVHDDDVQVDWLCQGALDRLGFGTPGEIQRFWEAADGKEVRAWVEKAEKSLVPVEVQAADGSWSRALAPGDIETRLSALSAPPSRLRILNPFDPVIRDRARLQRLFGFGYRVEMFVPEAKREWGYYVFPLLEGDRFVGRLEAKADRKRGVLGVSNLWPEPGVTWTAARAARLDAELSRFARLATVTDVTWSCPRPG